MPLLTISQSQVLDGNDDTDYVVFDVRQMVTASIQIVPSDAWGTASFNVKRSPDGTLINAVNLAAGAIAISSASSTDGQDIDVSGTEWLVVETGTAEGSALRVHVMLDAKGDG